MVSLENFTKHLKKKVTLSLSIFSIKNTEEGTFANSLYKASITLILKPDKIVPKKKEENYRSISS